MCVTAIISPLASRMETTQETAQPLRRFAQHLPILPVSVQPACRRLANVSRRVDRTGGNQQFVSDLRMVNLAGNLELHLTFQHHDQLVRCVPEILPALTWRIGP